MKKYPKLPVEFKRKWLKALRSGKYKQGRWHLVRKKGDYLDGKVLREDRHCCLGVACRVAGYSDEDIFLCATIHGRFKNVPAILRNGTASNNKYDADAELIQMNDKKRYSFKKIADWIQKNL